MGRAIKICFLVVVFASLMSCNITRKIPTNAYLLTKNSISITFPDTINKNYKVSTADLNRFIPLTSTPNKRILGMPFYLWVNNMSDSTKHSWLQRTLRKIGETPVLLDSALVKSSVRDMYFFMHSKGFFDAEVGDSVELKKQKASVDYYVRAGRPTIISSVSYTFNDKSLENLILSDSASSLIKPNTKLDRTVMEAERTRIVSYLENMGYYQFSVNNIYYNVDTINTPKYDAKVNIEILKNKNSLDNTLEENKIYRIKNIYINTSYDPALSNIDTIKYDTVPYKGINYIYQRGAKPNMRKSLMNSAITIHPDIIFSKEEIGYTSNNLSNLKFFKNVNILFNEIEAPKNEYVTFIGSNLDTLVSAPEGYLNCTIQCMPSLQQGYKIEAEASTNSNYTGFSLSLGYVNKNIFKGADIFDINGKVSYDFVRAPGKKNSYEFSAGSSLTFPQLLVPFNINRYSRPTSVSTRVDISFSTQRRPDYDRTISSTSFGYQWSTSKFTTFVFKPINLSLIKVPWISSDYLNSIENPYLRNSYTSQMILGMFGSYNYSTLNTPRTKSYAVKLNTETSGNFLNLISVASNASKEEKNNERYYNALGIRYAQYARADGSFVFKLRIKEKNAIVYRFYAGGGYAYGNTRSVPFERMFFAGGSSSMRGWQVRMLGPGGTPAPEKGTYPNQVGDIKLETNLEGRFAIAGPLHGAVFLDLGNIWSNGVGEKNSLARFKINSFYKQLALNTGIGARLDFSFFILRLDWGIQLRNPGWGAGQEWINKFKFSNTALHFGIGYPF